MAARRRTPLVVKGATPRMPPPRQHTPAVAFLQRQFAAIRRQFDDERLTPAAAGILLRALQGALQEVLTLPLVAREQAQAEALLARVQELLLLCPPPRR